MLRCPVSLQSLKPVTEAEMSALNGMIAEGSLRRCQGAVVSQPLQNALITDDKAYVYPVFEGFIPALLADKAISFKDHQVKEEEQLSFSAEKRSVQEFYDDFGWKKEEGGYKDTLTFEDRRPVADHYWKKCHLRLNKYFAGGNYLLDVASGSIPNDEYLSYHQYYKLRICMDFSVLALKEAALRLDGKGLFVLGDMTNIPLQDKCVDSIISMNTVYHVPQREQTKAVGEVYRVLKREGQAVIVYSWKKSSLMRLSFSIWSPILSAYKKWKGQQRHRKPFKSDERPDLFVQQQNHDWFAQEIRERFNARLKVYSAISRSFSNTFIRKKAFGRQLTAFIFFLENTFPRFMGRWGQYPVFLITKKAEAQKKTIEEKNARETDKISLLNSSQAAAS